ncbi:MULTISPECIES: carbohydrate ABC transporter permease [unclassified Oceanispirochaeta]|uniref:carbohydrate ABC transporter permease n=1 Tax=unclassified Oceanispirochaeta TaxID=2635722 RepID=UPI000E09D4AD|nr:MULTISPECIES: carbohydrate ABC transporter permease [unclassified Oceanispirochaeta]MBF9016903.1 carbohydrate ABC transporter permease [Oceanispirochaeta sp. M2]NPD73266.1 carbohydrate ABC transporter permease [Oceanispirochaeta sp. M1]RDG31132.1 carbohydrate ABC transporter permease [Oceanispirochaeta sp. M1]
MQINGKTRLTHVFLTLLAITMIYPFFWVIISSLKTTDEIFTSAFSLPTSLRFNNYYNAWIKASIGTCFRNSVIVSVIALALTLLFASMAAYVLARKWKNRLLFTYFTLGIMVPLQAIVIPSFIIIRNLGLINTRAGLILIYAVSGISFGIFVLTGFFKTIPVEMEEAAVIDGCGSGTTFFRIILPMAKPALATVGILSFLQYWNEYLFASVLIAKAEYKTLTQGIMALRGPYTTDYGMLTAGLALAIVPLMVAYVILQKQVIEGMTAGAVKG